MTIPTRQAREAYERGLDAIGSGREGEALPAVLNAIRSDSKNVRLLQIAGLLHRSMDNLEPAIACLQNAASLAPGDPKIAHALALSWFDSGRARPELFDTAAALAPGDAGVLRNKAAALAQMGRGREATALLESALRAEPLWVEGHGLLARLWSVLGYPEKMSQSLQGAIAAAPADPRLWAQLISILIHASRHQDALNVIEKARQLLGASRMLDANAAACLDELGDYGAARTLYDRLQPITEAPVAVNWIRHLLRTGAYEQAVAEAEAWTKSDHAHLIWPYLATAWRLTEDARWEWLEGDDRLCGVYDLGEAIGPIAELASTLRGLHVSVHQPLDQSLRGGTQTDGHLFARVEPEIRRLRAAIVGAVEEHVHQLPPVDPTHPTLKHRRDRPVRFSGSWSVRLTDAGFHVAHVHPEGWFSSAFYAHIPDPDERGPAPAGWLAIGEPPAELGLDLQPFKLVEPKPGRLALFPSTTWHGTVPFEAGERLTVAFDVAPPKPA